jgi:hypothetical protein
MGGGGAAKIRIRKSHQLLGYNIQLHHNWKYRGKPPCNLLSIVAGDPVFFFQHSNLTRCSQPLFSSVIYKRTFCSGFEILTVVVMHSSIFWDITPWSPFKSQPTFRRKQSSATCFTLVSCLACSLALKMEVTYSSEMSVDFQRTTRRYIPEDRTLQKVVFVSWAIFSQYLEAPHVAWP